MACFMKNVVPKLYITALVVLGITAFGWTAQAASVGPSGYTNSFSTQPGAADWSGVSIGSASATISDAAGLDAAVQTVAASAIASPLVADATVPPAASGTPE